MNTKVIWEGSNINTINEALAKEIMCPINTLINAGSEDDITDLFSVKLTEEECLNIMEMNVNVERIDFKRISISGLPPIL